MNWVRTAVGGISGADPTQPGTRDNGVYEVGTKRWNVGGLWRRGPSPAEPLVAGLKAPIFTVLVVGIKAECLEGLQVGDSGKRCFPTGLLPRRCYRLSVVGSKETAEHLRGERNSGKADSQRGLSAEHSDPCMDTQGKSDMWHDWGHHRAPCSQMSSSPGSLLPITPLLVQCH